MHPNSQRRVHSVEFKTAVLGQCRQPGASVAAVALAHGLNVNLVRKWLVGRGLKRAGLEAPRVASSLQASSSQPSPPPALQFVQVDVAPSTAPVAAQCNGQSDVHIELRRGGALLSVRWPASQAVACGAWLRELVSGTLK